MRVSFWRISLISLLVLIGIFPLVAWAAWQSLQTMQNTPILWLPPDFPERQEYERFRRQFQVRDSIVVSWTGCTVDDARLEALAVALSEHQAAVKDPALRLFDRVTTGYTAVREMTEPPLELPRALAIERLQGVLVGDDGETSCAIISLTEYGAANSARAVAAVLDLVRREVGIPADEAFLAGSPVEGVAINSASTRSIQLYLVPSGLLVLLLTRVCLRSWPMTLAVMTVAVFGQVLAFALVYLSGATMNAVLIVMAPLVFVLAVSAGVHLVNYYRDSARQHGLEGAPERALRIGWAPCSLAAVTTAAGLGSLAVSTIAPVRHFGVISAAVVLLTTGILFLLLPGVMQRWPARTESALLEGGSRTTATIHAAWSRYAGFVTRHAWAIVILALAVILFSVVGLSRVRSSVSILGLLVPETRIVRDYRWLENHLAPMVPIEVVVELDRDNELSWTAKMSLLLRLEDELDQIDELRGSLSAASFVPLIPRSRSARDAAERAVLERHFQSQRPQFRRAGLLYETAQREAWRITTRAPALKTVDYGILMNRIRARIEPVLDIGRERFGLNIRATYTGITPLVHAAQETLLRDLVKSFLTALVLVAGVMVVASRSIGTGLLAMIPNVFPTVLLFGGLGWTGTRVDIGSMMTASVALGIAIDGTLHFLTWYRRERAAKHSPKLAIERTYSHCATAMSQTTLICGVGLLVFAFSEFLPTQRFAWLLLLLLLIALVGDLLLLPALLFCRSGRKKTQGTHPIRARASSADRHTV